MTLNFQDMLKQQQAMASQGDIYQTEEPRFAADERFYTISKAQDGTGTVKVRFLPSGSSTGGLNYFVKRLTHNVKNEKLYPGGAKPEIRSFWGEDAICPKTKNKDNACPICDMGWSLYNEAKESGLDKKETTPILQNWVSKDEYIVNILILSDTINPSNNGKVFLFKLSKTILDIFKKENERIREIIASSSEEERLSQGIPSDVTSFDAFDLLKGKNITLKYKPKKMVVQPSDYWGSSYLDQSFTPIVKSESEYNELVSKLYNLDEFTVNATIKDEEFLQSKVDWLLFKGAVQKKEKADIGTHQEVPKETVQPIGQAKETVQPIVESPVQEQAKSIVNEPVVQEQSTTPAQSQEDFFARFQSK